MIKKEDEKIKQQGERELRYGEKTAVDNETGCLGVKDDKLREMWADCQKKY